LARKVSKALLAREARGGKRQHVHMSVPHQPEQRRASTIQLIAAQQSALQRTSSKPGGVAPLVSQYSAALVRDNEVSRLATN